MSYNLRSLSKAIRELAREHPAYFQVSQHIRACCDAIDATALTSELIQDMEAMRKQINVAE